MGKGPHPAQVGREADGWSVAGEDARRHWTWSFVPAGLLARAVGRPKARTPSPWTERGQGVRCLSPAPLVVGDGRTLLWLSTSDFGPVLPRGHSAWKQSSHRHG